MAYGPQTPLPRKKATKFHDMRKDAAIISASRGPSFILLFASMIAAQKAARPQSLYFSSNNSKPIANGAALWRLVPPGREEQRHQYQWFWIVADKSLMFYRMDERLI
jgi:hypothetical protein